MVHLKFFFAKKLADCKNSFHFSDERKENLLKAERKTDSLLW